MREHWTIRYRVCDPYNNESLRWYGEGRRYEVHNVKYEGVNCINREFYPSLKVSSNLLMNLREITKLEKKDEFYFRKKSSLRFGKFSRTRKTRKKFISAIFWEPLITGAVYRRSGSIRLRKRFGRNWWGRCNCNYRMSCNSHHSSYAVDLLAFSVLFQSRIRDGRFVFWVFRAPARERE